MNTRNYKVGILGYSGRVGASLLKLISDQYSLRLGRRNMNHDIDNPNAEYVKVDIFDSAELDSFMNGLDAVVNCAAPSYKIKDRVALAAARQHVAYVDAFGGEPVEQGLKGHKGKFIIGVGSFPGFSGILPIYLAEKYELDSIECISMISSSNETNSYGAVADLILSSLNHFGKANHYYCDGETVLCNSVSNKWKGFDSNDTYSEYINLETIKVAKKLNTYEAHWINVQKDVDNTAYLKNITMDFIINKDYEKLEKKVKEHLVNQQVDEENYKIACFVAGKKNGRSINLYTIMEFDNSYDVNAQILAMALENVLEEEKDINMLWAFEYLKPAETVKKLINSHGIISMETDMKICKE